MNRYSFGVSFFGGVGIGFFSYGRKQKSVVPLVTGLALMLFPYFMPNVTALVGILLAFIPYLLSFDGLFV